MNPHVSLVSLNRIDAFAPSTLMPAPSAEAGFAAPLAKVTVLLSVNILLTFKSTKSPYTVKFPPTDTSKNDAFISDASELIIALTLLLVKYKLVPSAKLDVVKLFKLNTKLATLERSAKIALSTVAIELATHWAPVHLKTSPTFAKVVSTSANTLILKFAKLDTNLAVEKYKFDPSAKLDVVKLAKDKTKLATFAVVAKAAVLANSVLNALLATLEVSANTALKDVLATLEVSANTVLKDVLATLEVSANNVINAVLATLAVTANTALSAMFAILERSAKLAVAPPAAELATGTQLNPFQDKTYPLALPAVFTSLKASILILPNKLATDATFKYRLFAPCTKSSVVKLPNCNTVFANSATLA